jgi:hypothetical protein
MSSNEVLGNMNMGHAVLSDRPPRRTSVRVLKGAPKGLVTRIRRPRYDVDAPGHITGTGSGSSNPMHREALRAATSLLCKEMLRPGQSTGLGIRESEEVEIRMRSLARLVRVWGNIGASANGLVTQLGVARSGTAASASEERERRLFSEALRDGYVLCQ